MHLIDVQTFDLKYFTNCPSRKYAILSHTWGDEELDFQTFSRKEGRDRKGFKKIDYCCEQAKHDGYAYAWIDTCCIDKSSSAELSEAINSMYAWYAQAGICYAYLADFSTLFGCDEKKLGKSRWFARGWTLQELIAPQSLKFYDSRWLCIDERSRLAKILSGITGIDMNVLNGELSHRSCSVAEKMSWAAQRYTTRKEDVAYSLLGLFGVNMPLLYGEGHAAFQRFQKTILEASDDDSIFAWTGVGDSGSGLLAKSPLAFKNSGNIRSIGNNRAQAWSYQMTSQGLQIRLHLSPVLMNTYLAQLQCARVMPSGGSRNRSLCIYLCRTNIDTQYRRVRVYACDLPEVVDDHACDDKFGSVWSKNNCEQYERLIHVNDMATAEILPYGNMPTIRIAEDLTAYQKRQRLTLPSSPAEIHGPQSRIIPMLLEGRMDRYLKLCNRYHAWSLLLRACGWTGEQLASKSRILEGSARQVTLDRFEKGINCFSNDVSIKIALRIGFNVDFEPVCLVHKHYGFNTFEWTGRTLLSMTTFDGNDHSGLGVSFGPDQAYHAIKGHRLAGLNVRMPIKYFDPSNQYAGKHITLILEPDDGEIATWYLRVLHTQDREFRTELGNFCVYQMTLWASTVRKTFTVVYPYMLVMSIMWYALPAQFLREKQIIFSLILYDRFKYGRVLARERLAANLKRRRTVDGADRADGVDDAFYRAWWAMKARR